MVEFKPFNIKQAIDNLALAWDAVGSNTIQNCWRHSRILPPTLCQRTQATAADQELGSAAESELQDELDKIEERPQCFAIH